MAGCPGLNFLLSLPFQLFNIFKQAVGPGVLRTFSTCAVKPLIEKEQFVLCDKTTLTNAHLITLVGSYSPPIPTSIMATSTCEKWPLLSIIVNVYACVYANSLGFMKCTHTDQRRLDTHTWVHMFYIESGPKPSASLNKYLSKVLLKF